MKNPQLKITEDGSHTLYVREIDECYHSTHGSVQEAQLIFIDYGFRPCQKEEINILEIGFGTGLNAFLTLLEIEKSVKKVNYTGLELFPVDVDKAISLNYSEKIDSEKRAEFEKLHLSDWNIWNEISPNFRIKKIDADFTNYIFEDKYDVIYFDAFSPEKQPEMWTEKMFRKLYLCSNEKAILTTYSCKGEVKRALKTAGFNIEKLPGPKGKREVLRAVK